MYAYFMILIFIVVHLDPLNSMMFIPERATIHYMNEDYITGVKMNVRRYGRTSGYYVNLEGTTKHTWGNNISFHVVLYELLHNEYKRTFVEFHFKHACEFLNTDPYLGKAVKNSLDKEGFKCPFSPGHYLLANMTLPCEDFPYTWPFERARGVGTVTCCNKVVIANGSLYARFVQKKKSQKI